MRHVPALLAAALAACSLGPPDPCAGCRTDEVCYTAQDCTGSTCFDRKLGCARRCSAASPCAAAEACVPFGDGAACHPGCEGCPAGSVCFRERRCVGVHCTEEVTCATPCGAGCAAADACVVYGSSAVCHPRCAPCAGSLCFRETACYGATCWEEVLGCAASCASATCVAGHACVDRAGARVCDPRCDASLCPARQDCTAGSGNPGSCIAVECGPHVPCANATDFCDAGKCFPLNGACASVNDCPLLDGRAVRAGVLRCDGVCRLSPPLAQRVPGLDLGPALEVTAPTPGQIVADPASVEVRWGGSTHPTILLVLDGVPAAESELAQAAIWGLAVPEGAPHVARLGDGVAIVNGTWANASAVFPQGIPLYLLVQVLHLGKLEQASGLVPFAFGSAWKDTGSACAPTDAVPGPCENPEKLQACVAGQCRLLCASDRDCPGGGACLPPLSGLRLCP